MDNAPSEDAKAVGSEPPKKSAGKKAPHNSQLRELMARKKKALPNDIHAQCREQLQEIIAARQFDVMSQRMIELPPDTLLIMMFAFNELKTNLLITSLEQNIGIFFELLNKQLVPLDKQIPEYLRERVVSPEQTYHKMLKLIVKKYNGPDRQFITWFLQNIVGQRESLLWQLFRNYFRSEHLRGLVMMLEHMVGLIEIFQELTHKMGLDDISDQMKSLRTGYLLQEGWGKGEFNNEELSVYSLPELKYNVGHHYATTGDFTRLKQLITSDNPKQYGLVHEFNVSSETPLDIAFRRCTPQQVVELMDLITKNPMVRISCRTINQILDNSEVCLNEPLLLRFMSFAKSEEMEKRGYLLEKKTEQAVTRLNLLRYVEASGKYPLMKFIEKNILPSTQVISELLFDNLRSSENEETYHQMLLINQVRKNNQLNRCKQQLMLLSAFEKRVEDFERYLLPLFEVAIHSRNEQTVLHLIQQKVYSNLVLNRVASGSAISPFLVCKLIEKEMFKAADLLLERFLQLIQWKRHQYSTVLAPFFELGRQTYKIHLLNELTMNLSQLPNTRCEQAQRLKQLLLKEYHQTPYLLEVPILQNQKLRYPINFLHRFLTQEELLPIYSLLLPKMAAQVEGPGELHQHFGQFHQDMLENNPQLVTFLHIDASGILLQTLLSLTTEPEMAIKLFELASEYLESYPAILEVLRKRALGSSTRYMFCWVKQSESSTNKKIFPFLFRSFVEASLVKGVELCVNQMMENVSNSTCQVYRQYITSIPDCLLSKIQSHIKPVFKSLVDADLKDWVRNVVTLGGDITILGQKNFEFVAYKEDDFWSKITNAMCESGKSFTTECMRLHISELPFVKALLEGSKLLCTRFIINVTEYTYTCKKESDEYVMWLVLSWDLQQKVAEEIKKVPQLSRLTNAMLETNILPCMGKYISNADLNLYLKAFIKTSKCLRQLTEGKNTFAIQSFARGIGDFIESRLADIDGENLLELVKASHVMMRLHLQCWEKIEELVKGRIDMSFTGETAAPGGELEEASASPTYKVNETISTITPDS